MGRAEGDQRGGATASSELGGHGDGGRRLWHKKELGLGSGDCKPKRRKWNWLATDKDGLSGGEVARRATHGHGRRERRRRPRRVEQNSGGGACRPRELPEGSQSCGNQGHRAVWVRGAARGRQRRCAAANGVTAGNREGRWSEGNSVINSKFKIPVCKLNFSPYSKGQMKNF